MLWRVQGAGTMPNTAAWSAVFDIVVAAYGEPGPALFTYGTATFTRTRLLKSERLPAASLAVAR